MSDSARPVLYVNVVVKDASEAVKERVNKKLHRSMLPATVKRVAGKHIGQAAGELTPPVHVAKVLSQSMCQEVPEIMRARGVTVEVAEAFREGAYFVLQLQVLYVNFATISAERDAMNSCYPLEWFLTFMGASYQRSLESDYLPGFVHKSLVVEMPKLLAKKLVERKIEAETSVMKDKDQARYFYNKLQEIREINEERKLKNPIRAPIRAMYQKISHNKQQDDANSTRGAETC